jgi:hypothetical protein
MAFKTFQVQITEHTSKPVLYKSIDYNMYPPFHISMDYKVPYMLFKSIYALKNIY